MAYANLPSLHKCSRTGEEIQLRDGPSVGKISSGARSGHVHTGTGGAGQVDLAGLERITTILISSRNKARPKKTKTLKNRSASMDKRA